MEPATEEDILSPADSDVDSLFGDYEPLSLDTTDGSSAAPALLQGPPINGLYFHPNTLLPPELVRMIMQKCLTTYFHDDKVNQVMLFERADRIGQRECDSTGANSTLPPFLADLLATLSLTMKSVVPSYVHARLFPCHDQAIFARQVIINHYLPGEGITPHVDLLDRFGDGIIGVSMGSGCAMRFQKVEYDDGLDSDREDIQKQWDVYLPSGSVYIMTEEARYEWTHGIEKRAGDWVENDAGQSDIVPCTDIRRTTWIPRSVRVSITFRWLLPGADVVGTSSV